MIIQGLVISCLSKSISEHLKSLRSTWRGLATLIGVKLRKAFEEKVREEEVIFAFKIMDDTAAKAKLDKPISDLIGEFRDSKK